MKEKLQIERQIKKMEIYFGGLAGNLEFPPSAVLVIDSKHEKTQAPTKPNRCSYSGCRLAQSAIYDPSGINFVPGKVNHPEPAFLIS